MTRGVEVALIPVFQFGVFSDSDLSYFAGPQFRLSGPGAHQWQPVSGRGNAGPLVLDDKTTAVGEIIRDRLANNYNAAGNYMGDVYVPNATGGCDPPNATTNPNCLKFTVPLASWSGGIPAAGTQTNVATWDQHVDHDASRVPIHRQRNLAGSSASDASLRTRARTGRPADPDHPESPVG